MYPFGGYIWYTYPIPTHIHWLDICVDKIYIKKNENISTQTLLSKNENIFLTSASIYVCYDDVCM